MIQEGKKKKQVIYDVIIVGAGPSGINAAIECQENNLSYLILEKGVLVNSIYNFPVNMIFFSTSVKLEIGNVPFISHNEKPTRKEALEYYRRILEHYNLNVSFKTKVTNVEKIQSYFITTTDSKSYQSKHVILATGYYDTPVLLDVPGENLAKVKHYYDDVHLYIRQKVLIVGAANSACDVALECWQKGADVTMVVRGKQLYQKVKYWILPNIENRIKEGSIKAYFNSEVVSISEDYVTIKTPEGIKQIENNYVLAMTGYKPYLSWFEKINIKLSDDKRTPDLNPNTLETNIPNLYMTGVIVSGMNTSKLFIENTRDHAKKIVHHIISK